MNYTPYMAQFRSVRQPGLPAFEPGTERHRVAGGGGLVVPLFAGDAVTVVDREGRQRCEIAAFAGDGREDIGALGLKAATESPGINRLRAGEGEEARAIGAALRQRGLPGRLGKAAVLFEGDSRAGESVQLTAQRDCIGIFHAPGGPMQVDAQEPPT